MATWYYTQEGTVFGPFSEEAMKGLIERGTVTFVTLVSDVGVKLKDRKWLYAYETPLTAYFTDEFQPDDLPDPPEADMPPIPEPEPEEMPPAQSMPEPTAQPEAAETVSPPPEAADLEKKPKTSPLLIIIFVVLFIVGLIIGAAFWYFTH